MSKTILQKDPNPLLRLWGNTCDKLVGFFLKHAARYADSIEYEFDDWCDCE